MKNKTEEVNEKMLKAQAMEKALEQVFRESEIEIVNDSEAHRGHGGYSDGETHFKLIIKSPKFVGMSLLQRHRTVHEALGPDLISQIHALELQLTEK